ncbi:hypothetical protein HY605_03680 [Candidatus Peregrinibacteria bacterium]|nr:hypothetical protein [Candidatus Peregrinibacteria bacterium]
MEDCDDIKRFRDRLWKRGIGCFIVQDLLGISDYISIFLSYISLVINLLKIKGKIPLLTLNGLECRAFTRRYFRSIFLEHHPFAELMVYFATRKLLKVISVHSIIYPFEGKGIERALIKARNKYNKNIKCVAYAHAIYNPGLLYVRYYHNGLARHFEPDMVACTGERMRNWLIDWGRIDENKVTVVGSSRSLSPLPIRKNCALRSSCLNVLVLAGLGHELSELAEMLDEDSSIFENCKVIVRKYPYSWLDEQKTALDKIRLVCGNVVEGDGPLVEQIQECDIAIMCATSAGIETMLRHRPVVYVDLHGIIDLNPFADKGDVSKIKCCYSAKDLKQAVNSIRLMPHEKYERMVSDQAELAHSFFGLPDRARLATILSH